MQQDSVLIQATENGFALRQQFAKGQETIALPACRLFLAPGEIGNISPKELQGIRYHAAGLTQSYDTDFHPGNLTGNIVPRLLLKTMQATHQFADDILHHPFIAIIADTGDNDTPFVRIANIDIRAFRGVKRTTHPDIPDVRTLFQCRPPNPRGVTQQNSVRIPDTACHLLIAGGYIVVHNNFFRKILQFLFC